MIVTESYRRDFRAMLSTITEREIHGLWSDIAKELKRREKIDLRAGLEDPRAAWRRATRRASRRFRRGVKLGNRKA